MAEYKYRFFLKFGKHEHIESLREKGQIYMNTLDSIRKLPQETLIGDKYEGIVFLKHLKDAIISGKQGNKKFSFAMKGIAHAYPTEKIEGNIYCLYGGDENLLEKHYKDDHGILPLGDTFASTEYMAVINNPREFIRRLVTHLEMAGFNPTYFPVRYLDYDKYEGKLDQFCKRKKYEGQNEFRIYVENNNNKPLNFEIGDLSNLCYIGRTDAHLNLRYKAFNSDAEPAVF
ncbi:hypothetical protein [Parapedobacter sp. DT-150]|uniref:hypothetical protein n=1 Tax=Parapedobacter sp. DT-150 TaxID=3396162 RepID=UPI003F1ACB73